ncbi:alpha/beta hydrolase [Sphingomonas sp.]|uniref:RBBP9/YdeN family alpha/beta hydrolase n=1 Tax=Sphingomonas sp. TaxID=28214 RepID=UPI0025E46B6B|nr:alpha/beta hydrolase [Sphingomonas sp.]
MTTPNSRRTPVLTLPGLGNSGPLHWQTRWEELGPRIARVELGMWIAPRRNPWVTKLEQAIRTVDGPVILVAHSLGCLAVAWWAALAAPAWGSPVGGVLLVAPPHLEPESFPWLTKEFGPLPHIPLPFPTIVVASHDDPYARFDRVAEMAGDWGAHLVDAGHVGHINAVSGLGLWAEGLVLLERLTVTVESGANLDNLQQDYDRAARIPEDVYPFNVPDRTPTQRP